MNLLVYIVMFTLAGNSVFATGPTWRVRHGDLAQAGQFPSTVLLDSGISICTGSIVGDNKVLTAGHCVCGMNKMRYVYAETLDYFNLQQTKKYEVASLSSNPKYADHCAKLGRGMKGTGVTGSDIAVITIRGQFRFSSAAKKGTISQAKPQPKSRATIAGFGIDENGQYGILKFGSVLLGKCKSSFPDSDRAICYIANENVNRQASGSGDSGGPMIVAGEIVGVTSGKISWTVWKKEPIRMGIYASTAGNMDYLKDALKV